MKTPLLFRVGAFGMFGWFLLMISAVAYMPRAAAIPPWVFWPAPPLLLALGIGIYQFARELNK